MSPSELRNPRTALTSASSWSPWSIHFARATREDPPLLASGLVHLGADVDDHKRMWLVAIRRPIGVPVSAQIRHP